MMKNFTNPTDVAGRRAASRLPRVLFIVFAVLAILCLAFFACVSKLIFDLCNGQSPSLLGYSFYEMNDSSMEPGIAQGSLVLTKPRPAAEFQKGDAIAYLSNTDSGSAARISRISDIVPQDDKLIFATKSDSLDQYDFVHQDAVFGTVACSSSKLGACWRFFTGTKGLILLIVLPAILLLVEVFLLIMLIRSKKRSAALHTVEDKKQVDEPSEAFQSPETAEGVLESVASDVKEQKRSPQESAPIGSVSEEITSVTLEVDPEPPNQDDIFAFSPDAAGLDQSDMQGTSQNPNDPVDDAGTQDVCQPVKSHASTNDNNDMPQPASTAQRMEEVLQQLAQLNQNLE